MIGFVQIVLDFIPLLSNITTQWIRKQIVNSFTKYLGMSYTLIVRSNDTAQNKVSEVRFGCET